MKPPCLGLLRCLCGSTTGSRASVLHRRRQEERLRTAERWCTLTSVLADLSTPETFQVCWTAGDPEMKKKKQDQQSLAAPLLSAVTHCITSIISWPNKSNPQGGTIMARRCEGGSA
jgi:hypothetical protein